MSLQYCILYVLNSNHSTWAHNTFTGDLLNKIEVHSMISTYINFGTVTASERVSIMAIMNANNFSTNHCVTQIDGVMHLEAKCSYICHTSFVTRKQYMLFLNGASIQDWIERFKFYGENMPSYHHVCLLNRLMKT